MLLYLFIHYYIDIFTGTLSSTEVPFTQILDSLKPISALGLCKVSIFIEISQPDSVLLENVESPKTIFVATLTSQLQASVPVLQPEWP